MLAEFLLVSVSEAERLSNSNRVSFVAGLVMHVSPFRLLLLLPHALFFLFPYTPAHGGHVLVFPGEYSHWLNMRSIMEELVRRNHSVTVLVADASPSVNYNSSRDATKFNFLVFKVL